MICGKRLVIAIIAVLAIGLLAGGASILFLRSPHELRQVAGVASPAPIGHPVSATAVPAASPSPAQTPYPAPASEPITPASTPQSTPAPLAAGGPEGRSLAAMAFDAATSKLLLFGGEGPKQLLGSPGDFRDDTWSWDGKRWTQEHPSEHPPARAAAAMVYDPDRKVVLLWGGYGSNGATADFWSWKGTTWTQVRTTTFPPPQTNSWATPAPTLFWDPGKHVVELLRNNGSHPDGAQPPDIWTWDGSSWSPAPAAGAPTAWGTVAYSPAASELVFLASATNVHIQTWTYDGASWKQAPALVAPPVLLDDPPPLAYFPPSGSLLAIATKGAIWKFDGDWSQVSDDAPLPTTLWDYSVGYDASRQQLVLFGGQASGPEPSNDTWLWDGKSWVKAPKIP